MADSKPFIIDDSTPTDLTHRFVADGEVKGRGLVPRDYSTHPQGYCVSAPPAEIKLIPRSDWSAMIKEGNERKSFLSHIRRRANNGQPIPSLDQNQSNYCWAHSATMSLIILRARANLPYKRLSAYAVGCKIKNFANQGGWGAQSCDFIRDQGVPDTDHWPEKSWSRSNDNPETWKNAAQHKILDGWWDLASPQYSRNLTFDQMMTLLLMRVPVIIDLNWWSHSVLALDPAEPEPGSFGPKGINSWTDQYGDLGEFTLQGSRGHPDGAVAPNIPLLSAA